MKRRGGEQGVARRCGDMYILFIYIYCGDIYMYTYMYPSIPRYLHIDVVASIAAVHGLSGGRAELRQCLAKVGAIEMINAACARLLDIS